MLINEKRYSSIAFVCVHHFPMQDSGLLPAGYIFRPAHLSQNSLAYDQHYDPVRWVRAHHFAIDNLMKVMQGSVISKHPMMAIP